MDSNRIKQIVGDALSLPPTQRAPFIQKQCAGDATLLAEVTSLLEAGLRADDRNFFPVVSTGTVDTHIGGTTQDAPTQRVRSGPQQIGPYRILERIGEGGMGVVYRAEQRSPIRREVVLKVIKLGMDTKLVIARFDAERQALAMMNHPHIACVYDAGADEAGRPYFVMEYVKGEPITFYSDQYRLSIRQRLELFGQVCQAIQHAHHKGIIHRDIKPSNVLVSTRDGRPFATVIDFGVAKAINQRLTDQTLFTEHASPIGTPQYMSPEQADGSLDIDTRTDVYSLAVLLYELLAGYTPFDPRRLRSAAYAEMARIIREEEPPKPSTRVSSMDDAPDSPHAPQPGTGSQQETLAKARSLTRDAYIKSLRGELDWIVMKALEKDRARRYDTPSSLAEDISRFLDGAPVIAAPPSAGYRLRKFVRKHRAALGAATAILTVLVLGIAGTSVGLLSTRRALHREEQALMRENAARDEAELDAYIANIGHAQSEFDAGHFEEAKALLDRCVTGKRGWEWTYLARTFDATRDRIASSFTVLGSSRDHKRILAESEGSFAVFDTAGHKISPLIQGTGEEGTGAGMSDDGTRLLTYDNNTFQVWDLSAHPICGPTKGLERPWHTRTNFDGSAILVQNRNAVKIWDASGKLRGQMSTVAEEEFNTADFSPDGKTILTTRRFSQDDIRVSRLWTLDGEPLCDPIGNDSGVSFTEDGARVLVASKWNRTAQVRELRGTGVGAAMPWNNVACVSRSGTMVLTDPDSESVQLWTTDGTPIGKPIFLGSLIQDVQFTADERQIFSVSGGVAQFWTLAGQPVGEPIGLASDWDSDHMPAAELSPNGQLLTLRKPGDMADWSTVDATWLRDADGRLKLTRNDGLPFGLAVAQYRLYGDNTTAYQTNYREQSLSDTEWAEGVLLLLEMGAAAAESAGQQPGLRCGGESGAGGWSARLSPTGSVLITATGVTAERPLSDEVSVHAITASPDGTRLVTVRDRTIRFYDTRSWRQVAAFHGKVPVSFVHFSPDGSRLLISYGNLKDRLVWDTRSIAQRQDALDKMWEERHAARTIVDGLFASPLPMKTLDSKIRTDVSVPAIRRAAALMELHARLGQLTHTRLNSAMDSVTERRVREAITEDQRPADSSVTAASAWLVVCNAHAKPGAYIEVLRAAVPAESGYRWQYLDAILGAAEYRTAHYDRALTALAKVEVFDRDFRYSAFLAMTQYRLGNLSAAQQALTDMKADVAAKHLEGPIDICDEAIVLVGSVSARPPATTLSTQSTRATTRQSN